MDIQIRRAILALISERTGIESLDEISLLPDEDIEDLQLTEALIGLGELWAIDDDVFASALALSSQEVQTAWEEVINSI